MIRIALTQPDVRPFRTPVFNLLAAQPDIQLTVFADQATDAPNPSAEQVQFELVPAPVRRRRFGPLTLLYQTAQEKVIDPDRFDLVIQSWNVSYRTLWPALRKATSVGLPVVLWGHGYSKRESRPRRWLRNRMGRRAAAVLLYTRVVAERLIREDYFDPNRVFVAQNAIDQSPIEAAKGHWLENRARLCQFQEEQQINPQKSVVFVSRLLAENRPDLLLTAIARMQRRIPGLTALLVGDGPERPALEVLARELGIENRVRFAGAIYNEQQLAPWLLSGSVFCYPENVGLSLLTGFGFGLPAVTADNIESQNPEIAALEHGTNGLLYQHGSVDSMCEAIAGILEDDGLRRRMSDAALATVRDRFNLSNMVQGFLDTTRLVDGIERRVVTEPSTKSTAN